MIEELKRQLAEIDKDLTPVLAHVSAAQERRAGLLRALAALEAVASEVKWTTPAKPEPAKTEKSEPAKSAKPEQPKKG